MGEECDINNEEIKNNKLLDIIENRCLPILAAIIGLAFVVNNFPYILDHFASIIEVFNLTGISGAILNAAFIFLAFTLSIVIGGGLVLVIACSSSLVICTVLYGICYCISKAYESVKEKIEEKAIEKTKEKESIQSVDKKIEKEQEKTKTIENKEEKNIEQVKKDPIEECIDSIRNSVACLDEEEQTIIINKGKNILNNYYSKIEKTISKDDKEIVLDLNNEFLAKKELMQELVKLQKETIDIVNYHKQINLLKEYCNHLSNRFDNVDEEDLSNNYHQAGAVLQRNK